jgi:hypothetical protein
MRTILLLVVMLATASLATAQNAPLVEQPVQEAERVTVHPEPAAPSVVGAAQTEAMPETAAPYAAQQERPSRVVWFLVGALTVAAIMLALLL